VTKNGDPTKGDTAAKEQVSKSLGQQIMILHRVNPVFRSRSSRSASTKLRWWLSSRVETGKESRGAPAAGSSHFTRLALRSGIQKKATKNQLYVSQSVFRE